MLKIVPYQQILRRFDIEVVDPGRYVVRGGIAYNDGFLVNLRERRKTTLS